MRVEHTGFVLNFIRYFYFNDHWVETYITFLAKPVEYRFMLFSLLAFAATPDKRNWKRRPRKSNTFAYLSNIPRQQANRVQPL